MSRVGLPLHTQVVIALPEMVGVRTTETASPSAVEAELPVTVITPEPASTVRADTYFVAVNELAQLSRLVAPVDCTISVTQVRAELAASTTSETLAFFV